MARGYPDHEGDKSGLYLKPEWAAKEGIDMNFEAFDVNIAWGALVLVTYTVTAGKTLYVCGISFSLCSFAAADGELNQIGMSRLYNVTDGIDLCWLGGNSGNGLIFPKPIAIPANKQVRYHCINRANHAANIGVTFWGYEI